MPTIMENESTVNLIQEEGKMGILEKKLKKAGKQKKKANLDQGL